MKKIITEKEITGILSMQLPELKVELQRMSRVQNIYKTMECFAAYSKKCIIDGNVEKLLSCFRLADTLLRQGNCIVISAIENVYIFSLYLILDSSISTQRKMTLDLLPEKLQHAYIKQLMVNLP